MSADEELLPVKAFNGPFEFKVASSAFHLLPEW